MEMEMEMEMEMGGEIFKNLQSGAPYYLVTSSK